MASLYLLSSCHAKKSKSVIEPFWTWFEENFISPNFLCLKSWIFFLKKLPIFLFYFQVDRFEFELFPHTIFVSSRMPFKVATCLLFAILCAFTLNWLEKLFKLAGQLLGWSAYDHHLFIQYDWILCITMTTIGFQYNSQSAKIAHSVERTAGFFFISVCLPSCLW